MVGLPAYADQEEEDSEEEEDTDEQPPQATAAAIPPDSKEATEARRIMLMPQSGGLESRCMDAPAARLWYTLERACGVSPCTKLATALSKKSLLRSVETNTQASSLAMKSKQVFLAAWWLWSFPRGRKYETKGLAHLTSQLS